MKRVAGIALVCVAACTTLPARPQWKVYLATNAPIPQLGEQVVVEILDGTNTLARRVLDGSHADAGQASGWPLSFGVVSSGTDTLQLHVRFYRTAITGDDGLPDGAMIDALANLPPVGDGVTSVSMMLDAACFGVAADVADSETCDPSSGLLVAAPTLPLLEDSSTLPTPGSWSGAATIDCSGDVPDGMVCVPGGAFILGAPTYVHISTDEDPVPERLVRLSAFAIDVDEMTVGTYRKLIGKSGVIEPLVQDPTIGASDEYCTFLGANTPDADAFSVNCISWASASAACAVLGKRLPTEAEWEFAAGNRTDETPYPWGTDANVCAYANCARDNDFSGGFTDCREVGANSFPPGSAAGGSPGDVTALGIRNLGGNLSEWVADRFSPYTASCWTNVDPSCSVGAAHASRGGGWVLPRVSAVVTTREEAVNDQPTATVGVRCAISM